MSWYNRKLPININNNIKVIKHLKFIYLRRGTIQFNTFEPWIDYTIQYSQIYSSTLPCIKSLTKLFKINYIVAQRPTKLNPLYKYFNSRRLYTEFYFQTRRTKLQCKFPHWRTSKNITGDVFVKTTLSFFMIISCFCIWFCSTKLWTFSGISSKWPCLRMRAMSFPPATERPKKRRHPGAASLEISWLICPEFYMVHWHQTTEL